MKTLKSLTLGLILLTVFGAAKAGNKPSATVLSKNDVISTYVDIVSHGKLDKANDIFDATVKFSMLRGNQVTSYSKAEMLKFMRESRNVEQNCTINTAEVENNNNVSVVKVDMQYNGFVRSNYVTVANTGNGWKITNVYTVFK